MYQMKKTENSEYVYKCVHYKTKLTTTLRPLCSVHE